MKYSFQNDYSEGAHPRIIEALSRTNLVQDLGYGEDQYCQEAAGLIRKAAGNPSADVHFISGGTQANLIFLSSFLRPFESVIAVDTAHICVHETGAIELNGHKVHPVAGQDGKVTVAEVEAVVAAHCDEHMVRPRAVYISQSTEVGTIYSAQELRDLSAACKERNLVLYLDGARLGSALTSSSADVSLAELSALVDAFYIGGTKNGGLIGEALVINNPETQARLPLPGQAKGRAAVERPVVGNPVPRVVQGRPVFRSGPPRQCNGLAFDQRCRRIGVFLPDPFAHEPDFPHLPR